MPRNTTQTILVVALLASLNLPSASNAGAIPPDPTNAALLYYQALLTMPKGEGEAVDHLAEIAKGEMEPDQIRWFLQQSDNAVAFVEAAAGLPKCDWGYRFSLGLDMQLPQLSQLRRLAFILGADARLHAFDGDYRRALEQCRLMDSLSRHVGDDTLVSYLVSMAVRELAMQCVQDIIGHIANEAEGLRELRNELAMAAPLTVSPIKPLKIEVEIMADLMQMGKRDKMIEMMGVVGDKDDPPGVEEVVDEANKKTKEFIASLNTETLKRAEAMYRQRVAATLIAWNTPMSYAQKYPQLKKLCDDFDRNDPAARVAGAFMANMAKIYTIGVRSDAHANAILAGVEICLARARSGRLPGTLPEGLPKDAFSGQDFEYKRTDDGFVLRCRKPDLDKNETYEYAFVVK